MTRDPFPPVPSETDDGDLLWQGKVHASRDAFLPPYDHTPADPFKGLSWPRMALWLFVLIPLHGLARRLLGKARP